MRFEIHAGQETEEVIQTSEKGDSDLPENGVPSESRICARPATNSTRFVYVPEEPEVGRTT